MDDDLYKLLDIDKNATTEEIKKKYKKLAFIYHPDKNIDNNNSKDMFQKITNAYEILTNYNKRKIYDLSGANYSFDDQTFKKFMFLDKNTQLFTTIFNILNPNFNKYNNDNDNNKNFTICVLKLTLEELYNGFKKIFNYKRKIKDNYNNILNINDSVEFDINPTWNNDDYLIINNKGDYNKDLKLIFKIEKHKLYSRLKQNLKTVFKIDLFDCLVGCDLELKLLDNTIYKIEIDELITPKYKKIIKNKGLYLFNKTRGDIIIDFDIIYPDKISKKKKIILKTLKSF